MTGTIAELVAAADFYNALRLGYDQSNRWDLTPNGETDCSALCGSIIKKAGYPIVLTGTFYTGNFAQRAKAAGFAVIRFVSLKQIKTGDFLVTPGHHVEFVYNVNTFFSARFDERGKASGGKSGNQNGRETGFVPANVRTGGWTYICRPPADTSIPTPPVVTTVTSDIVIAHCSLEAAHFGGPEDYVAVGKELASLGADVISITESISTGRSVFDAVLEKMTKEEWQREIHPGGKIAILMNATKLSHLEPRFKTFKKGDPWHGIVCVPVRDKATGQGIDIGAIHVRPSAVATPKQKEADIKLGMTVAGKWDFLVQGDWSSDPDTLMRSLGYTQISLEADTYDKPGNQNLDSQYVRGRVSFQIISTKVHDPGKWSDHKWVVTTIRITVTK